GGDQMALPLDNETKFGVQTRLPTPDLTEQTVELLDRLDFDSVWVGDHLAFTLPILDPFVQLAHACAYSRKLTVATGVYLLPNRHPPAAAKQAAIVDHLYEGLFIFGVGVGGEFPREWELVDVPTKERGARLTEGIEVMRKLWTGTPASHDGNFYSFPEVHMQPASFQPGGPPIWCGGRSEAALKRTGRLADGYLSYVITPDMFRDALSKIEEAAEEAGRKIERFGSGHLLFCCIDETYEKAWDRATELLSERYAMDFRRAAERYCAMGTPEMVAAKIKEFHDAGVRHFVFDFLGTQPDRIAALERFAAEVRPHLADIR
ncbi:MAG: LLM class flavin-dependent oxidoreductase, partial [Rickettsiales bacterium]